MTFCFEMDDSSLDTSPAPEKTTPELAGGAQDRSTVPADLSALASAEERRGTASFGFVPPHLVAEQHDY